MYLKILETNLCRQAHVCFLFPWVVAFSLPPERLGDENPVLPAQRRLSIASSLKHMGHSQRLAGYGLKADLIR